MRSVNFVLEVSPKSSLSYCTVFELVKVTKACRYDKDFYKMKKGKLSSHPSYNEASRRVENLCLALFDIGR